jgi:hypothetical protein
MAIMCEKAGRRDGADLPYTCSCGGHVLDALCGVRSRLAGGGPTLPSKWKDNRSHVLRVVALYTRGREVGAATMDCKRVNRGEHSNKGLLQLIFDTGGAHHPFWVLGDLYFLYGKITEVLTLVSKRAQVKIYNGQRGSKHDELDRADMGSGVGCALVAQAQVRCALALSGAHDHAPHFEVFVCLVDSVSLASRSLCRRRPVESHGRYWTAANVASVVA